MLLDTRDHYSHSLQNAMLNVYRVWNDGMYESFTTLALWPFGPYDDSIGPQVNRKTNIFAIDLYLYSI